MSSKVLSKKVSILNPVTGSGYTSRKRALQYVGDRQAEWAGNDAIRFIEDCHQRRSVVGTVDGGLSTFGAIKGLPIVGKDAVQMITANRHTPKRTQEQRAAAAKMRPIFRRSGPAIDRAA